MKTFGYTATALFMLCCGEGNSPQMLETPEPPAGAAGTSSAEPEQIEDEPEPEPEPDAPVTPTLTDKRVFITSSSYNGNLQDQGEGADGLDGADRLCAGSAADLGGEWLAWVSTNDVDALSRLPLGTRWTLIDGSTEVFPSRGAIQLGPRHAIDVDENGETVNSIETTVWTNTDRLGRNSTMGQSDACGDWSGQTGIAVAGVVFDPALGAPGLSWTDTQQPRACGSEHRLYCFEL